MKLTSTMALSVAQCRGVPPCLISIVHKLLKSLIKDDFLKLTFELFSVFLLSLSVWRLFPIAHSGKAWKLFLGFLQIWWCFLKLVLDDSFWRWRTLQLLLEVLWTWLGILNPLHGIIRQVPCCVQGTQSWNWLKLLSLTFPPDTRLLSRWDVGLPPFIFLVSW